MGQVGGGSGATDRSGRHRRRPVTETVQRQVVQLPDPGGLVHLQFRRYAGCPICNLHLHEITQCHDELADCGVTEIVVFTPPTLPCGAMTSTGFPSR